MLLLLGRRSRNVSQHLERRARVVDGYLFIVFINIKTRSGHHQYNKSILLAISCIKTLFSFFIYWMDMYGRITNDKSITIDEEGSEAVPCLMPVLAAYIYDISLLVHVCLAGLWPEESCLSSFREKRESMGHSTG